MATGTIHPNNNENTANLNVFENSESSGSHPAQHARMKGLPIASHSKLITSPSLTIRLLLGPPLILYAIRSAFSRPGAGSPRIVKMSTRNRSTLGYHGGVLSGVGSLHWMTPVTGAGADDAETRFTSAGANLVQMMRKNNSRFTSRSRPGTPKYASSTYTLLPKKQWSAPVQARPAYRSRGNRDE